MNRTYLGGSSNIFNKDCAPALDIACISSSINTLNLPCVGGYRQNSIKSLTESIPVAVAQSCSMTSK